MKNTLDGGDAVVQAFRCLGTDYVMASPGSEWGAVWEAFAKQTVANTPGPRYFSCVSNFPTAMLDLPIASSQANEALLFETFTERIPPRGTPVELIFSRAEGRPSPDEKE